MKRFLTIFLLSCILACHRANVFEPEKGTGTGKTWNNTGSDTVIAADIYFPGSGEKKLYVKANGKAVIKNFGAFYEKRTVLTDKEIEQIIQTFNGNDYQAVDSPPVRNTEGIGPKYNIYFSDGRYENTASFLPELSSDKNPFIAEIERVSERILNDGFSLELLLSDTLISKSKALSITLVVKNTNTDPIDFLFMSEITHDVVITDQFPNTSERIIWNLAQNQKNSPAVNYRTLAGGSSTTVSVVWDGKSNNGRKVTGDFYIYARVPSWPGGTTLPIIISVE